MQKTIFRSVTAVALALAVGVVAVGSAQAANDKYSFVARAIITDVDLSAKTIKADVVKATGKGKADLEGSNIEFAVGSAKVLKVASGKDTRVTYKKLVIGQEIGIKGVAKADDTFSLSFIRIHERSFTVIGLLESLDTSAKTMKILVSSSSYKPGVYKKGTEINMTYTDDSTAYENGSERAWSDINADAQRVKVKGTITGSAWQVNQLWNKHKGN